MVSKSAVGISYFLLYPTLHQLKIFVFSEFKLPTKAKVNPFFPFEIENAPYIIFFLANGPLR
jgi:hypothetical protein